MLSRRLFLKSSGIAAFGAGIAPGWLARAADTSTGSRKKVLVAIFQRGAVDGLNLVVPFGEPSYYDLRPNLAIPAPTTKTGKNDSALDLNGFFGLHPALEPFQTMFTSNVLAIVDAVGSPDPTRSHFDAQDYMESGTPGRKATSGGWLNRSLRTEAGPPTPMRAIGFGAELPRALRGANPALAVNNLNDFKVRDDAGAASFESMYASTLDAALAGTARETFAAVRTVEALQKQTYVPASGAKYPNGRLGRTLQQIAQLIKADVGLEVAFADVGGWDTHVNEIGGTAATGQLANLLAPFAQALAAFHRDMGDGMADVAVVTMSEFGRTAKENGNRGTDHGHANVMFAFGGNIRGGKVYGDWPGMTPDRLYENRDLAVTTDFRDVLGELVARHLGNTNLAQVFPGYATPRFRGLLG